MARRNIRLYCTLVYRLYIPWIYMKKMSVSKFKAKCLTLLNSLDPEGLEITRYGKVVARVIPVEQQSASLIGCMKGKIRKKDNLVRTGVKWHVES